MIKRIHTVAAALTLLAACANPVYVDQAADADLEKKQTYMWVNAHSTENTESARATAYADISMRNYVNDHLQNFGWKEVSADPDLLVTYDILVERGLEQRSDPVYSQPFTRYYFNPYTRRWGTIYYPSQFVGYDNYSVPIAEGTITISLIDAKTDRRVWQGWTTEDLNNNRFTTGEIAKAVRNIFRKFEDGMASR